MQSRELQLLHSWRRLTALGLFCVVSSVKGQGPPPGFFLPKHSELRSKTEVPLEFIDGGRAVVTVSINGRGPYRLGVETGAPFVLLYPAVVTELGLERPTGAPGPNARHADSLNVGALTLRDLNIFAAPAVSLPGVDGLLGLSAYHDVLMTIDYPRRLLVLENGSLPEPNGSTVFPSRPMGQFIGVDISLGARASSATIDTQGGGTFVSCSPTVADSLGFAAPSALRGTAHVGVSGGIEVRRATLDGALRLGRYVADRPSIDIMPHPPGYADKCILGIDFLSQFAVTIDQRRNRVRFVRPDSVLSLPPRDR